MLIKITVLPSEYKGNLAIQIRDMTLKADAIKEIWINPNLIHDIICYNEKTSSIYLTSGQTFVIKESPEEINELIRKARV